ncbi:MAG: hypothetical protein LQ350_003387 [Teloschistes chrysophthalmus]|nr:MAG: hypothetical protein LQ350_003387 [Niorma chrysophthalma]
MAILYSSPKYPEDCIARMNIANILSDLTSLRVCDHNAALALVSTRASPPNTSAPQSAQAGSPELAAKAGQDPDMQRATDLMELHHGVKLKHVRGEDQGLTQARRDVDNVLAQLDEHTGRQGSGR